MFNDTSFTDQNRELLEQCNLSNKNLLKLGDGESKNIRWSQTSRNLLGYCEEEYVECNYAIEGDNSGIVKVYVAKKAGTPPTSFNTSGVTMNENSKLHFGYIYWDDEADTKAIFFVIHPNSWGPYQHRFRTNFALAGAMDTASDTVGFFVKKGMVKIGAVAGEAISPIPVAGAMVGTAVAEEVYAAAGKPVVDNITRDMLGDYLRYIG